MDKEVHDWRKNILNVFIVNIIEHLVSVKIVLLNVLLNKNQ